MALQCGIIGIANVGKTTLFNCMSTNKAEISNFAFGSNKSNISIINVPDARLKVLGQLQSTDRVVHATVEIVDIPGLTKGSNQGEGVGNKFLGDIRNTDALLHVIRCFDDANLPHIDGSVDPVRDIETVDFELQVKDIESIDKKIQKYQKLIKSGDKDAAKGLEVLNAYKNHIGSFLNARTLEVKEDDKKYIYDLFLLTMKPVIFVCNVDEKSATTGNVYVTKVKAHLKGHENEVLIIAGKTEAEIAELTEESEQLEFLESVGLKEPGVNKVIRAAYSMLNLQSFFTIGQEENRAWTIRKGMKAPQAAGVIHSDLERGFIRAEVMKYNDFITLKSEQACKEAGKFNVQGKDYLVDDGDILHIRFNV